MTRYSREKRIKRLLTSLKLSDSKRKIVKKWNALVEGLAGECGPCRHTFKRSDVDWIEKQIITSIPHITQEEIALYMPYDSVKRTFALQMWGYDDNVIVIDEDVWEEDEEDEEEEEEVAEEFEEAPVEHDTAMATITDDVEFVAHNPAPTITAEQHIRNRARQQLIPHRYSRIQRPRPPNQHLHLCMHRLREQGWSELEIERHFRNH